MDYRIDRESTRGLDDSELAWAAIEPLMEAFSCAASAMAEEEVLAGATEGQRLLLALDWCQKEVRNGGFEQFFWNSTGGLWRDALEGFLRIGGGAYAELLGKALAVFPDGEPPLSRDERCSLLEAYEEEDLEAIFDPLESAFYGLLDQEETDLERLRAAFVRANPGEFFRREA